jgi:hypothetical protein
MAAWTGRVTSIFSIFSAPVAGTIPATTLRKGLALVLSGCGDGDHAAGGAVCLFCFAAMCAKTNNLAAVGSLA